MNFYNRDFLKLLDYSPLEVKHLIDVAKEFKYKKEHGIEHKYLKGKNIAIIFEKDSTRTRCSFEVAAYDLGMHATYLGPTGSQMGKKETIADTARVLSRIYDGIEYRGYSQNIVEELAKYSSVPVWNGLTDEFHPTQMLADFMTMEEHFGSLNGLNLVFVGDCRNNAANSLMVASSKLGVNFTACGPKALWPSKELIDICRSIAKETGSSITITDDLEQGLKDKDVVYTDVWVSMGEDPMKWQERISLLSPYQINKSTFAYAKNNAIFMHALPSFHNLETTIAKEVYDKYKTKALEVTDDVFESRNSVVFNEAENRMHTIKAMMYLTLKEDKND